jgi:hypothetical protein
VTGPIDELSNTTHSTSFELLAKSYFLSEMLQEMWFRRHQLVDVLHSQVDAFGYDLVLTTAHVTRHVQLKTRRKGGSNSSLDLNIQLETLPSACVILMDWRAPTSSTPFQVDYRWFGGQPSDRIPSLGDKVARHSKGNAAGTKLLREQIRTISIAGHFEPVASVSALATKLFGRL